MLKGLRGHMGTLMKGRSAPRDGIGSILLGVGNIWMVMGAMKIYGPGDAL